MAKESRLITAALPYTNNVPHIGNIVGSHLPADIFARYCRNMGHKTVFVGGTDEHGSATEVAAVKHNVTPKQLCDFFYKIHKEIYDWFEISYDNFSRTSKEIHYRTTQEFFKNIHKNGYITEQELELPFCKSCQRMLTDRFIEGTCPHCGYDKARGDQCENCSTLLDPINLKNPYCTICGNKSIVFQRKKHLFLDLKKLSKKLESWIKKNKHWRLQVRNLALGWTNEGLKSRCITRDLKWGVPVPFKKYEDKVFYCWFDAPIGYISSTREWNEKESKKFWQGKNSKYYFFIGKDNIPFHTIFFPGMLIANGKYNLPANVLGYQYLNYENSKFSKSKGHGVFCENLPTAGLEPDYWRFYLSFLIPETKDTEFFWKEFQERVNGELVANFGNFVNRTLTFTHSKLGDQVPSPKLKPKDKKFILNVQKRIKTVLSLLEKAELRQALEQILLLSHDANKYIQENEPWKELDRAPTIMYVSLNVVRILGLLIEPYLPATSQKIKEMLNLQENNWNKINKFELKPGDPLSQPKLLFRKLEDKDIEELKQKTSKVTAYDIAKMMEDVHMKKEIKKEEAKLVPLNKGSVYVPFEEFKKSEFRVATITKVENHPNADKLYVLAVKINDGEPGRQIVAGLRQHYKPEELMGKKVVIFVNLQPAVIRGIESHGMLLAADDGKHVSLLQPDKKDTLSGAVIR